ncbi:unnamed protein product [Hymenolepis diminuta]|uniref:DUF4065 domain-containing protein n=1 Tax=Hymenolepis diminuta TaxID=6216 RepID=A0A0R3SK56_HYMDI|nr:unnamed protein product [Hymenolepis diminuta]
MDLEKAHVHRSNSGEIIYCGDRTIGVNDETECPVEEDKTNISQEETKERSGWSLYDLYRRLLQAIDWAGERLAGAVGLTDPKFDTYLWEREYLDKEQAEREANTFVIDPT